MGTVTQTCFLFFSVLSAVPLAEALDSSYPHDCDCRRCNCRRCDWFFGHDFWTRERFTGDLWGEKSGLAESGIITDLQLTQFYQGVATGGLEQVFRYGGKLDYYFTFKGGHFGLNKDFSVDMHAETRFGQDVNADADAFAPVNLNMLYPNSQDITAITGLQLIQKLSNEWKVTIGKNNTLDFINALYPETGRGVNGFMNACVTVPTVVTETTPLSSIGIGFVKMRDKQIEGTLLVYDNHNPTTTSGFEELFDNGANISGLWRFFTEYGGLPGSHLVYGAWGTGKFDSYDPWDPSVDLVGPTQRGTWCLAYIFEQKIWVDPRNDKRSLYLLSQWGIADPKTSPYRWTCNVSLQSRGFLLDREQDTMGVAYFFNGISSDYKQLDPLVPLQDEPGVELYYNAEITPWFHITADLQVIEPAIIANDTAVVFGLRAKLDL